MKKNLIILLVLVVLVYTGCQQAEKPEETGKPGEQVLEDFTTKEGGDTDDKNNKFNFEVKELNDVPFYFTPTGWLNSVEIIGQASERLIAWNVDNKHQKILAESIWTGIASSDGKCAAYANEEGLKIVSLVSGAEISPVSLEAKEKTIPVALPMLYAWSPDGKKLIYAYDFEWTSEFYIYDGKKAVSTPYVFKNFENFLSYPVGWIDNEHILFVVSSSTSKTGEQQYTEAGYRSNLLVGDLSGNLKPLTDTDDFNYIWSPDIASGKTAYILYKLKNNAKELHVLDLESGSNKTLLNEENLVSAAITAGGDYVLYHTRTNDKGCIYAMNIQTKEKKIVSKINYAYSDVIFTCHDKEDKVLITIKDSNDSRYDIKLVTF
ncbi:MAG: hypothetical protein H0Z40_01140 [Desulfotomaculum sp.]|nr:hypothetical protein [Desulfotomaculum sp.]